MIQETSSTVTLALDSLDTPDNTSSQPLIVRQPPDHYGDSLREEELICHQKTTTMKYARKGTGALARARLTERTPCQCLLLRLDYCLLLCSWFLDFNKSSAANHGCRDVTILLRKASGFPTLSNNNCKNFVINIENRDWPPILWMN